MKLELNNKEIAENLQNTGGWIAHCWMISESQKK
jgi:hypothetical protein